MRYRFLAIALGLLAGFIVIVLAEGISGLIHPLPAEIDRTDTAAIETFMREQASAGMFLGVLLGYLLGAFAGGFAAAWFEKLPEKRLRAALITGAILMAFGLMNLFMLPHPAWFWVSSLLVYIPASWLGGKLGIRMKA